jgi:S-adenosylmethionine/arginine decarboxylase-like enzyme
LKKKVNDFFFQKKSFSFKIYPLKTSNNYQRIRMKKLLVALVLFLSVQGFAQDYWGYHLILDCKGCDKESVTSATQIESFVKELVLKIDMKAYGEPIIEHFAADNPEAAGYSLVQLIETSAITAHFVDANGDIYLDVFSCKRYDPELVIETLKKYFNPQNVRPIFVQRQA